VNQPLVSIENLHVRFRTYAGQVRAVNGVSLDIKRGEIFGLVGETGCGKTHLAAAIVNYRYEVGKPALFVVVPDFLDHLRSAFNPDSKVSYDELFESVKTAPLLVLDDFGEQSTNPWVREKLYQLINFRYNSRLPTVITTRYSLDDIMEKVDSSISSRLVDRKVSVTFGILAPDYRNERRPGQKRSAPRGKSSR